MDRKGGGSLTRKGGGIGNYIEICRKVRIALVVRPAACFIGRAPNSAGGSCAVNTTAPRGAPSKISRFRRFWRRRKFCEGTVLFREVVVGKINFLYKLAYFLANFDGLPFLAFFEGAPLGTVVLTVPEPPAEFGARPTKQA